MSAEAPATAPAVWRPSRPPRRFEAKVAGVTFVPGYPENLHRVEMLVFRAEQAGGRVRVKLVRNPQNPHDPNAIEVHVPGEGLVGHIPAAIAAWLAPMLDAGVVYDVELDRVAGHPDAPGQPGLRLVCELAGQPATTGRVA